MSRGKLRIPNYLNSMVNTFLSRGSLIVDETMNSRRHGVGQLFGIVCLWRPVAIAQCLSDGGKRKATIGQ